MFGSDGSDIKANVGWSVDNLPPNILLCGFRIPGTSLVLKWLDD